MKQFLMCLLLICGFAVIHPVSSMASEDSIDFYKLTNHHIKDITNVEIMSGVTGKTVNITSLESVSNICSIMDKGKFIEYKTEGNAGGWIYKIKFYFENQEAPFEYVISYGSVKDGKNYILEDTANLKKIADEIFNTTFSENAINVSTVNGAVEIKVNGEVVKFNDEPFIDENGRTQVPVRELCEFLNKRVYWFENPQRVAISTVPADLDNTNGGGAGGDSIEFVIGENKYSKNGKEYPMDTVARIINTRTYIPLRIVGEFLNYDVIWQ